jgi:methionyl-tRNA synthetase
MDRVETILFTATEVLRIASLLLHPVMPERTATLWIHLGLDAPKMLNNALQWGRLDHGSRVRTGEPLFPRIDTP